MLPFLALAALYAGQGITGSPALARAAGLAGTWHVSFYLKCIDAPANVSACIDAENSSSVPIMGVKGTTFIDSGTDTLKVDGHGHVTFQGNDAVTERDSYRVFHCDEYSLDHVPFSGTCTITSHGAGHVAASSKTGALDFWVDEEYLTYHGRPLDREHHFSSGTDGDTEIPAVARSWITAQYLRLIGDRTVPPGITISIVVTKH
jgi:hypothetical protein